GGVNTLSLVIGKEERLVLLNGSADRTAELVLLERRLHSIEECTSVEKLVAEELEGRAMYRVAAGARDHVDDRAPSGELGIRIGHLNLELGDALQVGEHFDGADHLVAVVQTIDHEHVERAAGTGGCNFGAGTLGLVPTTRLADPADRPRRGAGHQ